MFNLLTVLAQDASQQPQQQQPQGGGLWITLITLGPYILFFGLFMYFFIIRPQKKQQKEKEAMLGGVKRNDVVLTNAGIYGVVDKVKDNDIFLKIDEDGKVRVKFHKSAILTVVKKSDDKDTGAENGKGSEGKTE